MNIRKKQNPETLIDDLWELLDCTYLSDLRLANNIVMIKAALEGLEPEAYTLKAWNEAVRYILDDKQNFGSAKEARDYMLKRLSDIISYTNITRK